MVDVSCVDGASGCGSTAQAPFSLEGSGLTVEDLFKALDVDGDGIFSEQDFNDIDENKNGYLDDSELAELFEGAGLDVSQLGDPDQGAASGGRSGGGSGGGSPSLADVFEGLTYEDLLALFDKDGDGALSMDELKAADRNGDGVIDAAEIEEAKAELEAMDGDGVAPMSAGSDTSLFQVDAMRQQLFGGSSAR